MVRDIFIIPINMHGCSLFMFIGKNLKKFQNTVFWYNTHQRTRHMTNNKHPKETLFYHWDDNAEHVTYTDIDDAIEDYYDVHTETPETIQIHKFRFMTIQPEHLEHYKQRICEHIHELLDEDFGDWEEPEPPTEEMVTLTEKFIADFSKLFHVIRLEDDGTETIDYHEWLGQNHPSNEPF